jgi:hypothetical protein
VMSLAWWREATHRAWQALDLEQVFPLGGVELVVHISLHKNIQLTGYRQRTCLPVLD